MPIRHHDKCFGCGPDNPIGLHMEVDRCEDGSVAGAFEVRAELMGPPGYAHGGIMSAALDEVMSLLVHDQGTNNVTGALEVALRAAAPVGSWVHVEARIEEANGSRSRIVGVATDRDSGRVLATSEATIVADRRG